MTICYILSSYQGFGLTIGSDFYLLVNPGARRNLAATNLLDSEVLHGYILNANASLPMAYLGATFTFIETEDSGHSHIVKGSSEELPSPKHSI